MGCFLTQSESRLRDDASFSSLPLFGACMIVLPSLSGQASPVGRGEAP